MLFAANNFVVNHSYLSLFSREILDVDLWAPPQRCVPPIIQHSVHVSNAVAFNEMLHQVEEMRASFYSPVLVSIHLILIVVFWAKPPAWWDPKCLCCT